MFRSIKIRKSIDETKKYIFDKLLTLPKQAICEHFCKTSLRGN